MLSANYELTISEVQLLSSRGVLVVFFARKGFGNNTDFLQSSLALVLSADSIKTLINYSKDEIFGPEII